MRRCAVLLAWLAAGCRAADPCASFDGQTCLELDVRWASGGRLVDQLAVRALEGFTLDARTPPAAMDAFELPALVPIALGQFQGAFSLVVRALRSDGEIGSGELAAEIPRRVHRRYRVELSGADTGDLVSASDAGGSIDLATGEDDLRGVPSFTVTPSKTTVMEHERFTLHLIALDARGAPDHSYAGIPDFTADWGDVRVSSAPTFVNGEADATVSLNRETNGFAARILASDGDLRGRSPDLLVNAPPWTLDDATLVFGPGSNSFDSASVDRPSWTRKNSVYELFYRGQDAGGNVGWGTATSLDGLAWTRRQTANILPSTMGWDTGEEIGTWKAAWDGFRFVAAYDVVPGIGFAQSGDGIAWTHRPTELVPGSSAGCSATPFVRSITAEPGRLRVYLESTSAPCEIESSDVGSTWTAPRPTEGLLTPTTSAIVASLLDGSVHRIWFNFRDGTATTGYATSSDGIRWLQSPAAPAPALLETVLWNEALERYEALYLKGGGFYRATRP